MARRPGAERERAAWVQVARMGRGVGLLFFAVAVESVDEVVDVKVAAQEAVVAPGMDFELVDQVGLGVVVVGFAAVNLQETDGLVELFLRFLECATQVVGVSGHQVFVVHGWFSTPLAEFLFEQGVELVFAQQANAGGERFGVGGLGRFGLEAGRGRG